MKPVDKYQEARWLLDKLKSEHNADTNKAEAEMTLVAYDKNSPHFLAKLSNIRYSVAVKCWLDPQSFYQKYKDDNWGK